MGEELIPTRSRRPDPDNRRIAVTGACSFLGRRLLERLEEDRRYGTILALDIRQPDAVLEKTRFHRIDLTVPAVDGVLAHLLEEEQIDTVVHAAFLSYPTHATAWAHELEDVGTMHVLNACRRARPGRFVLCSHTMVYGASASNPNFLGEERPMAEWSRVRFVRDKINAELQTLRFAEEHPDTVVTRLRFAAMLGPTVANLFTRFFSRPVAPVLMGYDPLLQFLHESDAVDALQIAVDGDYPGAYNIVGQGVLPYTTILALMGKLPLPMPHAVARGLSRALWATQIFDSPPHFLNYLRYLCVADGRKARAVMGFEPQMGIKRTINDFIGVGPLDTGVPDITRAQG